MQNNPKLADNSFLTSKIPTCVKISHDYKCFTIQNSHYTFIVQASILINKKETIETIFSSWLDWHCFSDYCIIETIDIFTVPLLIFLLFLLDCL